MSKQLRRDIEMLQKALNPSKSGYDWRKEAAEIQMLLKEYEKLTAEEKVAVNAEVLESYTRGELDK